MVSPLPPLSVCPRDGGPPRAYLGLPVGTRISFRGSLVVPHPPPAAAARWLLREEPEKGLERLRKGLGKEGSISGCRSGRPSSLEALEMPLRVGAVLGQGALLPQGCRAPASAFQGTRDDPPSTACPAPGPWRLEWGWCQLFPSQLRSWGPLPWVTGEDSYHVWQELSCVSLLLTNVLCPGFPRNVPALGQTNFFRSRSLLWLWAQGGTLMHCQILIHMTFLFPADGFNLI